MRLLLIIGMLLVAWFASATISAAADCTAERTAYALNKTSDNSDRLIKCLLAGEGAQVTQVATDCPPVAVPSPTLGIPRPGNPTTDQIEDMLRQFKADNGVSDKKWAEIMTSTFTSPDTKSWIVYDGNITKYLDRQGKLAPNSDLVIQYDNLGVGQ